MPPSYLSPGLTLRNGSTGPAVKELQRDLRSLGYLRRGIDGSYGAGTANAVKALQHDLLNNAGGGSDGRAPVAVTSYNRGRVTAVTGTLDQGTAACVADMLADPAFPRLPASPDPHADNQRIAVSIAALPPTRCPTPYLVAVLKRESGMMHFAEPRSPADSDTFVVVGTDLNGGTDYTITSRGYGAGQYTLFHHPPRADEVTGVIENPALNVNRAAALLREKLDSFVAGPVSTADDRIAEIGSGPVRLCKFAPADPRFMTDCKACVAAAGVRSIQAGLPVFPGSGTTWAPVPGLYTLPYSGVPVRERIGCDWPYAVRRYNGGGLKSYHYQALVLKNLAALP